MADVLSFGREGPSVILHNGNEKDPMGKKEIIEITINDVRERVVADSTLETLISDFGETDPDLIVELNGRFVYPRAYASTIVKQADRLEFINPNFGG
jgi:thiamine biosynthesis protein ThiS